ncbi:valine--tRNA ligase [Conexibacter sp. DBS9H8]|uniref:valine--tRNA ligase n=1 Tax=Conexibacter sp. DBS9H8 TaxID=2937801 RepID=UPI00200F429C|nr:valine--tRNA ligase [Conexibacter sp. DBS9H8]
MTDAATPIADLADRTRYEPSEVEPRIAARWLEAGISHPEVAGTAAENYSIAIPPPNVTGVLHMGHALNLTIQDTLARTARQRGQRVKWIHGTDHAGIATQTVVEKELVALGGGREELGRDAFIARVWAWRERYGFQIVEQQKRLGASADFTDEHFTMDPAYAEAVATVFCALYEEGLIYRDHYMVNWDPGSRSAISDLEVEEREVDDRLYHITYPLESGEGSITVATVRPETLFADVAVAVNPADERYAHLVGQHAILPIVGTRLEIIADAYVKREFGTGALKITPGHDVNDFEIGQRHGLPAPSAIGEDGRLAGEVVPERYRGLRAGEAQAAVVAELRELGLLVREEPYRHTVPHSHRSGERIEPLISLQWFMAMDQLARPAIAAVRDGRVRFHPENQRGVYLNWMENIRPWCISRQLWWGHQIPVWYRGDEVHCALAPPEGEGWERDPDVLDTWFSSALWPFVTLGWPAVSAALRAFYPTDALVTSRDIIFLWVARMIMMGIRFAGDIPFSDVYIHSIIQAPDGRRMSKSLGTGIDPLALIDGGERPPVYADGGAFPAYGADALRWGLLAMSSAQDVRFNEEKIAQGRQLTNKLWNAARLILSGGGAELRAELSPAGAQAVEDRWILSRLVRARASVTERVAAFDFAKAAQELYDFIFSELCDWYLELVKPRLAEPEAGAVARHVLTETLALAHPVIPFVTEEIWSHLPGADDLLAARVSPAVVGAVDEAAEATLADLIAAVTAVRGWRNAAGVKASATLRVRLEAGGYADTAGSLARLGKLELCDAPEEPVAVLPVPGGQIAILASDAVDLGAAEAKRQAERERLGAEITRAQSKLANPGFVAKANPAVVAAERAKLARLEADLKALDDA